MKKYPSIIHIITTMEKPCITPSCLNIQTDVGEKKRDYDFHKTYYNSLVSNKSITQPIEYGTRYPNNCRAKFSIDAFRLAIYFNMFIV